MKWKYTSVKSTVLVLFNTMQCRVSSEGGCHPAIVHLPSPPDLCCIALLLLLWTNCIALLLLWIKQIHCKRDSSLYFSPWSTRKPLRSPPLPQTRAAPQCKQLLVYYVPEQFLVYYVPEQLQLLYSICGSPPPAAQAPAPEAAPGVATFCLAPPTNGGKRIKNIPAAWTTSSFTKLDGFFRSFTLIFCQLQTTFSSVVWLLTMWWFLFII